MCPLGPTTFAAGSRFGTPSGVRQARAGREMSGALPLPTRAHSVAHHEPASSAAAPRRSYTSPGTARAVRTTPRATITRAEATGMLDASRPPNGSRSMNPRA